MLLSIFLVPFLFNRLLRVNDYWQIQISFALIAIVAPSLTLFPLLCRSRTNNNITRPSLIWSFVIFSYTALTLYALQSTLQPIARILVTLIGTTCLWAAIEAYRNERSLR